MSWNFVQTNHFSHNRQITFPLFPVIPVSIQLYLVRMRMRFRGPSVRSIARLITLHDRVKFCRTEGIALLIFLIGTVRSIARLIIEDRVNSVVLRRFHPVLCLFGIVQSIARLIIG